ncbi:MAG: hypothetical protein P0Y49_22370 [Candidatus Pedobacter colombiensis]|uniref:Uncharacterized protein n=1 Tax=Candidatus Pedobacter colombiensis TaxID=3121371 RepID=A0AAJ5W7L6_9SPHI|nr:hypothetical protein [Pedobacter sp.]WEK19522.1 MAG: hypothetical protein P0Y49_22370 [Pedobacter sp.]
MKKNITTYIVGLFAFGLILSACKKNAPDQWLQENITIIGKVPVIASFTVKPPQTTNVGAGSTVTLDLRYWSDDPIDKINLRATVGSTPQQIVSTTAYQKAYSQVSRTDSLLLPYPVPTGLAVGTAIVMEVEVVNKNTLNKKATLNLKVQ